jgi:hypothetical protein
MEAIQSSELKIVLFHPAFIFVYIFRSLILKASLIIIAYMAFKLTVLNVIRNTYFHVTE